MTVGLAVGEAVGGFVGDLMGLAVDEPSAKEPVTWWVHWLGVISIKISSNTPSAGTMTVVRSYSMKPPEGSVYFLPQRRFQLIQQEQQWNIYSPLLSTFRVCVPLFLSVITIATSTFEMPGSSKSWAPCVLASFLKTVLVTVPVSVVWVYCLEEQI